MSNEKIKSMLPSWYKAMHGDADSLKSCATARKQSKKRKSPEADNQRAILHFLRLHKSVVWAERMNTGAMKIQGQYGKKDRLLRFGFVGCSDIIGQMVDGRFLAIEVKSASGRLSDAQRDFLDKVRSSQGVACMARSVDDVVSLFKDEGY